MPASPPVILGYDLVSPLGTELIPQWERAARGESGVVPLTRFAPAPDFPVQVAGQVPEFDEAPFPFLAPREMALWPSPIFRHAMLVTHRALARAGVVITPELAPEVGITLSAAVGGLDAVLWADRRLQAEGKLPPPWVPPNSCINMVGGKLSMLTGATGPLMSTITACATAATSLIVGAMLLAQGRARVVICGGVDFPLVEPILAGFATMNGAIKGQRDDPARASRPFSADRKGFVVSEGAAALILADREFARAHGLPFSFELAGWSLTSDAHHYVAPHLPTVARAMAEAVADAGLAPGDVDLVSAHATSTKAGDLVEAQALAQVFGARIPPVWAGKSLVGHTMGAAAGVELILALMGAERGLCPPTLNHTPDPAIPLDVVAEGARPLAAEHLLKNAFGFGGTNSCLLVRRVN
ncbi:MAG: beta-ketoacyl-[acyl-carrier-protein] synthase family protein [Deltaproteobacteria bacterium]|nr:beta-ketoacyl-[acyl-carrier-protein] synthase family protein [Deltaproteobacteria bacterium]